MIGGHEEGETADSVKNVRDGHFFSRVVSGIPYGNFSILGEICEPGQVAIGFECAVDVARVSKDSGNHVDVEVLVTCQLHNLGVVGLAVHNDVERRKAEILENMRTFD